MDTILTNPICVEKTWNIASINDQESAIELAKSINVNPVLGALLYNRGITTFDQAKDYFRPSLTMLHDPFLLQDMDKAVARLQQAILDKEKIMIYGDYDVDGTTAVTLFYGFLSTFYPFAEYYIPDRYKEGYGVSEAGVEWARESGVTLIITLDCGIRSHKLVDRAQSHGVDFIICDHHMPGNTIPNAFAVLNPKRIDCQYPFKELSGCGVGFKFLQAFCISETISLDRLYPYLDLVAISIAGDIVPIIGENRVLTYFGLQIINEQKRVGLLALKDVAGFKKNLTVSDLVFGFSPRINAAGRIVHAKAAVELMLCEDTETAMKLAAEINQTNSLRKEYDSSNTVEALNQITELKLENHFSTVLFNDSWHKGVVGIVASRCIEQYHRPTIILTESNGKATGSARSVNGFDLYNALLQCDDLLEQWGGHTHAAGLTLQKDNLENFQQRFEQIVSQQIDRKCLTPKIDIDGVLTIDQITLKFHKIISQMAPFGPANMQPVFVTYDIANVKWLKILKEQHLKFSIYQPQTKSYIDVIGFKMAQHYENLSKNIPFNICYQIELNEYMGKQTLQLLIRDIQFPNLV